MSRLAGWRVMVVEDSYLLAMELTTTLRREGASVLGPFSAAKPALASLDDPADCAVLDVNLGTSASFDLARALLMRRIPFLFFTGYDQSVLPPAFAAIRCLEKPVDTCRLLQGLQDCRAAGGAPVA